MTNALRPNQARIAFDKLRDAAWLTPERVRLWGASFALTWVIMIAWDFYTHTAHGVMNVVGGHLGRDFINYWAGATLAAQGHSELVYNLKDFHDFQIAGAASEWKMYSYPPVLLLLTLPLALLPFIPAFILWTLLGLLLCVRLLAREIGSQFAWIAMLGAPAAFWNAIAGQNGFFTAVFFAGGILLLKSRPMTAGLLFGLLCYKPQLGLLIPVALLAGRHWRCFFSAAVTVALLGVITLLLFGQAAWQGFLHQTEVLRGILDTGNWYRMPTVFMSLHLLGLPVPVAYAAQLVSALAAAFAVVAVWRGQAPVEVKGAVLAFAAFLATPYAWDYDMVVLTFAVAWLVCDAKRASFMPWEKFVWMLVIVQPIALMSLAQYTGFQPAPFVLWAALVLACRRALLPETEKVSK